MFYHGKLYVSKGSDLGSRTNTGKHGLGVAVVVAAIVILDIEDVAVSLMVILFGGSKKDWLGGFPFTLVVFQPN